jgi:AcrR family transcriptional regulator
VAKDRQTQPSARERILDAAGVLFSREGFHAVGIDTITAESGVAKMTLYRHFPSKDALIAAYLNRVDDNFWRWLDGLVADIDRPLDKITAVFEGVSALASSPEFLGCSFQMAALEFPGQEHQAHQLARAHKETFRERMLEWAGQAGLREPEALANALLILMDGAWVAARVYGPQNPSRDVADAAKALLDAHQRP